MEDLELLLSHSCGDQVLATQPSVTFPCALPGNDDSKVSCDLAGIFCLVGLANSVMELTNTACMLICGHNTLDPMAKAHVTHTYTHNHKHTLGCHVEQQQNSGAASWSIELNIRVRTQVQRIQDQKRPDPGTAYIKAKKKKKCTCTKK